MLRALLAPLLLALAASPPAEPERPGGSAAKPLADQVQQERDSGEQDRTPPGRHPGRGAPRPPEPLKVEVVPIRFMDARVFPPALREALQLGNPNYEYAHVSVTHVMQSNALLVSGPAARIPEIRRLIAELDVDRAPAALRPTACWLDVAAYEVTVPADKLAALPLVELQKAAADVGAFLKQLALLGEMDIVGRLHQRIDLSRDCKIQSGSSLPIHMGSVESQGRKGPQVSYHDVGMKIDVQAVRRETPTAQATLTLEVSTVDQNGAKTGRGDAPRMNRYVLQSANVAPGTGPVVALGSAAEAGGNGAVPVCIARIVLDEQ